jgi:hypothetical protein
MRTTEEGDERAVTVRGRRRGTARHRVPSVTARRVEVHRPERLPPAARVHPLLTLFVSEDENTDAGTPQLHALFALLDAVGAAEVHQRTAAQTSWRLLESARPSVALRLEITAPADACGVVDLLMDAEVYGKVWQLIRGGRWVGITSSDRLRPHEDGSAAGIDEVFAACIPIDSVPPPMLAEMIHAAA